MADQRIQYAEEMVGAGHPTKSDTLNRLTLVEHNNDGTHKDWVHGAYILIRDQKTAGTNGGTFTTGSWQTRVLNTEVVDVGGYATVAGNQVTLAAGTYECRISAPAYKVGRHQIRLRNVTAGSTILVGSGETSTTTDDVQTRSFACGRFTIAAGQALEVQHQCSATKEDNGLGWAANFGEVEVFTILELWKVAP